MSIYIIYTILKCYHCISLAASWSVYGSYALADTTNLDAKIACHEIGSGLNAGLSTEGTRTMTFTGTLFSLFAENGNGTFETGVALTINPDVDYKL